MRFYGNIEAKLDAKGRVAFPSVFRKVLQASGEETLYVRMDLAQKCMTIYPESVWNAMVDDLTGKINEWDYEEVQLLREFVSRAELLTLDGSGRILLPRRMLQKAGIEQTVNFLGMVDRIEVWPPKEAEEPFMDLEEFNRKMKSIGARRQ